MEQGGGEMQISPLASLAGAGLYLGFVGVMRMMGMMLVMMVMGEVKGWAAATHLKGS